ncbi:MAG: hypothetical protein Q9169_003342 [Polycauliona sp. 2 TL-2023]
MSRNPGGPPFGELSSHVPPYNNNNSNGQTSMNFGMDATQYYESQAHRLRNHHSSVLQPDQVNSYAFNTNFHILPSNSHPAPSTVSPSFFDNENRSKIFSGSFNNAETIFPGNHTHPTAHNSDMEDGELSESAGHSSSREPISYPSQLDGAPITKASEQDGLREEATGMRQKNEVGPRTMNGVVKHGPNAGPKNQVPNSKSRKQLKKSLYALQSGARDAVAQLQRHDIGYAQLLEEHIHPDLLKKLYPTFVTNAPQQTHNTTAVSKPPDQQVQPHPLPKKLPEPTFRQQASNIPIHESMSEVPEMNPSKNADTKQLPKEHPSDRSDVRLAESQAGAPREKSGVQKGSEHQHSSKIVVGEPATSNGLVSRTNQKSGGEITSNVLSGNDKSPTTDGRDNKSIAVPSTAPNSLHPSITHPKVKPAIPKTAAKPVDRKDYIARLQAAKAGKVASTVTGSQPSPVQTTHQAPQESSPNIANQLAAASPALNSSAKSIIPGPIASSIDPSVTTLPPVDPTVETKKREQTELARRKIEELKSRSNLLKPTQFADKESSLPVASPTGQPDQAKQLVGVQPTEALTRTINSAIAPSTPQHAYFPSRNGTFSLPGLFMSTANAQDYHDNEAPPIAAVQDDTRNLGEPEPTIALASTTDSLSSQPLQTAANLLPHRQEKENQEASIISPVTPVQANGNPRKRPTAADFIEQTPSKVQRSYSYTADSSVVFEVSDEEADETDNEGSDVVMSGDPGTKASQSRKIQTPQLATGDDQKASDSHGKSGKSINRPNMTQSSPQNSTKKDADGLRAREEEIERMNRKIIEMEQRRKLRQDISRTQTPGTPGRPPPFSKPTESNSDNQSTPNGTKQLSEPPAQATREAEDAPHDEAAAGIEISVEQQRQSPDNNREVQPRTEGSEAPIEADQQRLQRRKTEIESRLSSADATVETLRLRLEVLHRDEADLQTQIQNQLDSKILFQKELAQLLQAPSSSPALPRQSEDEVVKLRQVADGQDPDINLSLGQSLDDNQVPAVESANISDMAPVDSETSEAGPMSVAALSTEAPSNQSVISGELAEDVMDISGSEDGGEVTENVPISGTDAAQPAAKSESEEPYEPPSSFGGMQEVSNPLTDSSMQQQSLTNEGLQQHDHLEAHHTPPAMDNGTVTGTYDAARAQLRKMTPPGHAQTPIDLSDSDDYEPPEPVASRALPHANDKHGHFVPYESPLQQFHAYRYHPDFVASVGNGYRSLTYSHKIDAAKPICPFEIGGRCNDASCDNQHFSGMNLSGAFGEQDALRLDFTPRTITFPATFSIVRELTQASNVADDMILVQMGSIPEGLSEEQRTAFVVGLRQTIQKIRVRKVKDFKTVASEIAAYRARFLGDSSKILPL